MKGTASHLLEFLEGARKRFIIPENCKQLRITGSVLVIIFCEDHGVVVL